VSVDLKSVIARRDRVLEAIVRAAERDVRVRAVVVVGSLAAGSADAYSDIDLALVPESDGADSLLADRLTFPAVLGDVVLQVDSSWNVWTGAAQVLTLFDGELPLWVDMDIWTPSVPGSPRDARVLAGEAPPPIDLSYSEFASWLKEERGLGQVASDNVNGALDVAGLAWWLKGLARGKAQGLADVEDALDAPWSPELEPAREPLRRFAHHVRGISA
jgi:predicted nucleotidyltransferase